MYLNIPLYCIRDYLRVRHRKYSYFIVVIVVVAKAKKSLEREKRNNTEIAKTTTTTTKKQSITGHEPSILHEYEN